MNPLRSPRGRRRLVGAAVAVAVLGTTAASTHEVAAVAQPRPTVTDDEVSQAARNVLSFVLANAIADTVTSPCPMLLPDELGWFLGQHGFAPNLDTFSVDVFYNDLAGDGYPGIDCGVDVTLAENPDSARPHYPVLGAAFLSDDVTFQAYLDQLDGTITTPAVADANLAGEVGGYCGPGGCWIAWHRDSLVLSLAVVGGQGDITQANVEAALLAMVPTAVAGLTAWSPLDTPGTTNPVPAPTTAPVPVPPSTVAPTVPTVPAPTVATVPTPTVATVPAPTVPASTVPAPTVPPTVAVATVPAVPTLPVPTAATVPVPVLTAAPVPTADPVPTVAPSSVPGTGLDVIAAKAGLARYFSAAPIDTWSDTAPCPLGTAEVLGAAMAANGLAPASDQFEVSTIGLEPTAPATPQLFCAMSVADLAVVPRGSVYATDITGVTTFAQIVTDNAGHAIVNTDPAIGGELAGNCYDYEGRHSCWVMWHRDGLVLDVYVTGTPRTFDEATTVAIVRQTLPQFVANLAAYQP